MILDTGAGPNCVKTSALPQGWEERARLTRNHSLTAANGGTIPSRGMVTLYLRLGDLVARQQFLVVDNLPVPMIIGTRFQDKHVFSIDGQGQQLILKDDSSIPIVRDSDGLVYSAPPMVLPKSLREKDPRIDQVRLTRSVRLMPGRQTTVSLVPNVQALLLLNLAATCSIIEEYPLQTGCMKSKLTSHSSF